MRVFHGRRRRGDCGIQACVKGTKQIKMDDPNREDVEEKGKHLPGWNQISGNDETRSHTSHIHREHGGNTVNSSALRFCLPARPVEEKPLHKPTAGVTLTFKRSSGGNGNTHPTVRGDNATEA